MRHGFLAGVFLPVAAVSGAAHAQTAGTQANAQGDLSLTIYNNGQTLVQDVRQTAIPAGRSSIAFPDVSAQIRPETLSFSAAGAAIVEQNFDFDLLTPSKLMEKAIGQTVTLVRTNPATGREQQERAKVLSTAGGVVIQIGERIEVLRDDGLPVRVIFDQVPANLRARPTLSVTVDSAQGGTRPASLRYLTPGLGWAADYVALYDEARGTLDMQGWVTLTNSTGTTFENADTLLVAGGTGAGGAVRRPMPGRGAMVTPGLETPDRERLGDYYLYPIQGRTTVANNQTKQVSFLDVQGVAANRIYARTIGWLASDNGPVNVATKLAFTSSRDGGLGDALPAGTVRFYQKDRAGNAQFIGESGIGHTPMGSTLALATGDAFDISVQAEVEKREVITSADYERSARYRVSVNGQTPSEIQIDRTVEYYRTTMRYTLRNASARAVDVELTQSGMDRGAFARDVRVTQEDVAGQQITLDQRKYTVSVPANGERVVRVTYETRY